MNKYLKSFLIRGLMFGGFGPIIVGIVFFVISLTQNGFFVSGTEILVAIISTYLLAFIQAGASIFNQIEDMPIYKSLAMHMSTLYVAYTLCYIVNSWIPFEPVVLLIFTVIFLATYFVIWLTVYFIVKSVGKKLNSRLENAEFNQ